MNDYTYENLACNARILYDLTQKMQKIMLEMFIDEFIRLDQEEARMRMNCQEPPF